MFVLVCSLFFGSVPWDFHPELLYRGPPWWLIAVYIIVATLAGSAFGFIMAMRISKKFNKKVRESVWFNKLPVSHVPAIRKSLRLPPTDELSSLFSHISEEDKRADEEDHEASAFNPSRNRRVRYS
jgi:hypothetical protein